MPREVMAESHLHFKDVVTVSRSVPKALVLQVCRLKDLVEHRVSVFLLKHVLALKSRSCLCV